MMSDMSQIEQIGPARPEWTLTDRLAKARRHAGLTQTQLAKRLEISLKQFQRFEQGKQPIRRGLVLGWAMACQVDAQWLEHGDDFDGPEGGQRVNTSDTARQPFDINAGNHSRRLQMVA